jgi:hypothetical protein
MSRSHRGWSGVSSNASEILLPVCCL